MPETLTTVVSPAGCSPGVLSSPHGSRAGVAGATVVASATALPGIEDVAQGTLDAALPPGRQDAHPVEEASGLQIRPGEAMDRAGSSSSARKSLGSLSS